MMEGKDERQIEEPIGSKEMDKIDESMVPLDFSKIGLISVRKMSELQESQRLFLPLPPESNHKEELFIKPPRFNNKLKRSRKTERFTLSNAFTENIVKSRLESICDKNLSINEKFIHSQCCANIIPMLKQQPVQQWMWMEFIDTNFDEIVYNWQWKTEMEKMFNICCKNFQESRLPRRVWQVVRRNYGKSRRFSPAFIAAERFDLEWCRGMIRDLQKSLAEGTKIVYDKLNTPKEIPLQFAIGANVMSLVRMPTEMGGSSVPPALPPSLCYGRVLDFNLSDFTYLVKFDIHGKDVELTVPDYWLYSLDKCEYYNLCKPEGGKNQSLMETTTTHNPELIDATVSLQKRIQAKTTAMQDLTNMNTAFESTTTTSTWPMGLSKPKATPQRDQMQRSYTGQMITMYRLNNEIIEPHNTLAIYLRDQEKPDEAKRRMVGNELYKMCRTQAECDVSKSRVKERLKTTFLHSMLLNLQTILYMCNEMGYENFAEVDSVIDDFVADTVEKLPNELRSQFEDNMKAALQQLRDYITHNSEHCQQMVVFDAPQEVQY